MMKTRKYFHPIVLNAVGATCVYTVHIKLKMGTVGEEQ